MQNWNAIALSDETRSTPLRFAQGDTLGLFMCNPFEECVAHSVSGDSPAPCSRWTAVIPSETLGIT